MKITVIGCGWLGMPLSVDLISRGNKLFGSTTSINKLELLRSLGIESFVYSEDKRFEILDTARDSAIVIVNFPPSKSPNYAKQIENLLNQFSTDTKVIFTSSTGIYEDVESLVNENGTVIENHPVRLAEKAIQNNERSYCILRLSGLIGNGRHPIHFLQGREKLTGGTVPVNLIHQKDVIAAIESIIANNKWNCIYNLSYPNHPNKRDYYAMMAKKLGLKSPIYIDDNAGGKEIDGSLITIELDFNYLNPIDSAI